MFLYHCQQYLLTWDSALQLTYMLDCWLLNFNYGHGFIRVCTTFHKFYSIVGIVCFKSLRCHNPCDVLHDNLTDIIFYHKLATALHMNLYNFIEWMIITSTKVINLMSMPNHWPGWANVHKIALKLFATFNTGNTLSACCSMAFIFSRK